jgi:hypothetical protein
VASISRREQRRWSDSISHSGLPHRVQPPTVPTSHPCWPPPSRSKLRCGARDQRSAGRPRELVENVCQRSGREGTDVAFCLAAARLEHNEGRDAHDADKPVSFCGCHRRCRTRTAHRRCAGGRPPALAGIPDSSPTSRRKHRCWSRWPPPWQRTAGLSVSSSNRLNTSRIFVGHAPLDLLHWPQATPSQALRRRPRHESSAAPAPRTFSTHLPQPRLALLPEPRHHVEPVLGRPPALRVPPPATRDFHLIHLLPSGVTPYVVPRLCPILRREAPPPARGLNRNRGPPTTHDASTSDCTEPQRGAPARAAPNPDSTPPFCS